MRYLNIGCGNDLRLGFLNVDKNKPYDKKVDLELPEYPFKKNTFDYILADNVLEHVHNIVGCIEELHRICKPDGSIEVIVPYYNSPNAFRDLTHCNFFNLNSFDQFNTECEDKRYNLSKAQFRVEYDLHPSPLGRFIPRRVLNMVGLSFGNVVSAITFRLYPVKREK